MKPEISSSTAFSYLLTLWVLTTSKWPTPGKGVGFPMDSATLLEPRQGRVARDGVRAWVRGGGGAR